MAETAASSAAVQQYVAQQLSTAEVGHAAESSGKDQLSVARVQHLHQHQHQQQHLPAEDPQADPLQQHWQQLCCSIEELDSTSDLLVRLVQSNAGQKKSSLQPGSLQLSGNSSYEQQTSQHSCPSNTSISSSSAAVDELQQQLSALQAEKQRIEADRQDMALQQGQYKGTIAQVGAQLQASQLSQQWQACPCRACKAGNGSLTVTVVFGRAAGGCPGIQ
jgi:uncharacterized small protein (DUF1192 family)